MKYEDSDQKLRHARKLFEDAIDHSVAAHDEAHRASRFYHNTDGEGQWESGDLKYLRENERMALTFNITKTKVDTFLGMYADAQRTPKIGSATGDKFLAEILNDIMEQMLQDANYESVRSRQLKSGTIQGECSIQPEFTSSEDGDNWVALALRRYMQYETNWDINSIEPDRSDARYVFIHRWMDKEEFFDEYPEYKKEWESLHASSADIYESIWGPSDASEVDSSDPLSGSGTSDYHLDRMSRYYYDKPKNQIRVIRYEYKTKVTKYYAVDQESGQRTEIPEKFKERIRVAEALGHPVSLDEKSVEEVHVCDFIGTTILKEYDEAGPFKGFSLVPYSFEVDEETGSSYGLLRNLFDPQMELNKSKSIEVEYMAQASAPGTLAEEGAINDLTKFSDERRKPNGIAIVAKDALVTGRVSERTPTPPSEAVARRMEGAVSLLHEVSGIPSTVNMTAAEHAQPGVVYAIKYHKSRQTVSDPFSNYEIAQKKLIEKIAQGIVTLLPDDQILAILGGNGKYTIEGTTIAEIGEGPPSEDGQPTQMIVAQADLRDLRTMKWKLDMEYTSENSTLRMIEFDLLMQLVTAGVPVDPEILVEDATNSRSRRERLKEYVNKAMASQQQAAEAQQAALEEQNRGYIQAEFAKIQETIRHNQATEYITITDVELDAQLKGLSLYEKADNDEKSQLIALVKAAIDAKKATKESAGGTTNG